MKSLICVEIDHGFEACENILFKLQLEQIPNRKLYIGSRHTLSVVHMRTHETSSTHTHMSLRWACRVF